MTVMSMHNCFLMDYEGSLYLRRNQTTKHHIQQPLNFYILKYRKETVGAFMETSTDRTEHAATPNTSRLLNTFHLHISLLIMAYSSC